MIALYSINLRIMGRPNIALLDDVTIFTYFENDFLSNIYSLSYFIFYYNCNVFYSS